MTTAKPLKDLNSQPSLKKPFRSWINRLSPTLLLASLLGTYLDLFFVGIGLYSFPTRPFPSVFSINLAFTLIGLPLFTAIFLVICDSLKLSKKIGFILLLSLIIAVFEKISESFGFFAHTESWHHLYSFLGYSVYLAIISGFYKWTG